MNEECLPRYILSNSGECFQLLMGIAERGNSESGELAWNLIQKLSTNKKIYDNLLELTPNLELPYRRTKASPIQWGNLIPADSIFNLLYSLEIIDCFMEDVEDQSEEEKEIEMKDIIQNNEEKYSPMSDDLPSQTTHPISASLDNQTQDKIRDWKIKFLQLGGLKYLLKVYIYIYIHILYIYIYIDIIQ